MPVGPPGPHLTELDLLLVASTSITVSEPTDTCSSTLSKLDSFAISRSLPSFSFLTEGLLLLTRLPSGEPVVSGHKYGLLVTPVPVPVPAPVPVPVPAIPVPLFGGTWLSVGTATLWGCGIMNWPPPPVPLTGMPGVPNGNIVAVPGNIAPVVPPVVCRTSLELLDLLMEGLPDGKI